MYKAKYKQNAVLEFKIGILNNHPFNNPSDTKVVTLSLSIKEECK